MFRDRAVGNKSKPTTTQTSSNFTNEETAETQPATAQQSISSITVTTPHQQLQHHITET